MENYLDLIELDPFYRIYFHDGSFLDYTGDSERMKAQMRQFNSHDAENYDRFIEKTALLYQAVITDGLVQAFQRLGNNVEFSSAGFKIKCLSFSIYFRKKIL